jgi:hypothetical protein
MWETRNLIEVVQLEHRELIRQAEREHLARIVVNNKRRRLPRPMLLWTGRRLLASGQYLLTLAGDSQDGQHPVRAKKFSGA